MSKRKLLLADDSITIQKVVNLTFADEGIEVIAVGDGDAAMRKFDEFMPDLVMADVNMPGLNGYEVCRIIKLTEETRHIPVILLVGSFEPFDEAEANAAGANDFLTKPFQSIRQLVNKVTDLLNQSERVEDAPQSEMPSEEAQTAPVADTFAETLEFNQQQESAPTEPEDRQEEIPSEFGDAGMDDEMIETSPANDYDSGQGSDNQAETTIDYAKTQPLNADDLKGFNLVTGENTEQQTRDSFENQEFTAEAPERAEPATFAEEARKLEENQNYQEPEKSEEKPENISETEPQIDYYLPTGEEEFEKEITDAETLEPEVSFSTEQPREADFSQTETVFEETDETEEMPYAIQENESVDFDKTLAYDGNETETSNESPEIRETSETGYTEDSQTAEIVDETEADEEAESDSTEKAEFEDTQDAETISETPIYMPANAASLNFDDGDLLELPPLVEETGIRPQPNVQPLVSEPEAAVETPVEPEPEVSEPEASELVIAAEIANMQAFPPELIEAIAQKVAEKISAKTMNDVLPQITELVMKKLAEEKLKE